MSSNSRWYLDTQHSFSFKADTKFRALHYNLFEYVPGNLNQNHSHLLKVLYNGDSTVQYLQ